MWIRKEGEIQCTLCEASAPIPQAPCDCTDDLPQLEKKTPAIDGALLVYLSQLDDIAEKIEGELETAAARDHFNGCATLLRLRKEQYGAIRDASEASQIDDLTAAVAELKERMSGRQDGELIADLEKAGGAKRSKRSPGRQKSLN